MAMMHGTNITEGYAAIINLDNMSRLVTCAKNVGLA